MNHFHFPVRFGSVWLSWTSEGLLSQIGWSESRLAIAQKRATPAPLVDLIDQIRAFIHCGEPLNAILWDQIDRSNWSTFQLKVYQILLTIPHGETRTYGWVSHQMGQPFASRAVGQALKRNPLPILIPCHRILASNSIGGFMGKRDPSQPELQLKQHLIRLEEEYRSPLFSFIQSDVRGFRSQHTGGP